LRIRFSHPGIGRFVWELDPICYESLLRGVPIEVIEIIENVLGDYWGPYIGQMLILLIFMESSIKLAAPFFIDQAGSADPGEGMKQMAQWRLDWYKKLDELLEKFAKDMHDDTDDKYRRAREAGRERRNGPDDEDDDENDKGNDSRGV
jgi:hypothetical protein